MTLKMVEGDFVLSASGRFATVSGRAKTQQLVRVALGKSAGIEGTGAGLDALCGIIAPPEVIRLEVRRGIRGAFASIRALQARYQQSARPLVERVAGVSGLRVATIADSPTDYFFRASIATEAGPPVGVGGPLITRVA